MEARTTEFYKMHPRKSNNLVQQENNQKLQANIRTKQIK